MLRRAHGFTLIELMLVVSIIGVLAAIAMPAFGKFSCRAKQSEAKAVLKQIVVAQEAYRGENDTYVHGELADLVIIGVVVTGNMRYTYSVPNATQTTFLAVATGTGDVEDDLWEITEANDMRNEYRLCDSY